MPRPIPKLIGKITITTGSNDRIYWWESDGGGDLSGTLIAGEYYVDALMQHIASIMNAGTGNSSTYIGQLDNTTGIAAIFSDSKIFYLKFSEDEGRNVLTGGDPGAGTRGALHLGWEATAPAVYEAAAVTHSPDVAPAHVWYPSRPPRKDSERDPSRYTIESNSIDGTGEVFDFSGVAPKRDTRRLQWQRLSQADRENWLDVFWGPYAGGGGHFKYYNDRTQSAYAVWRLTKESLDAHGQGEREQNYSRWSGQFLMKWEAAS